MITIDPGKNYLAFAEWHGTFLVRTGMIKRAAIRDELDPTQTAIIEEPWGVGKSTTKDILQLTLAAGEYGGYFPNRKYVLPSSCPKPIRHQQALKRLHPEELVVLPKQKTKLKHVLCAVWIGLQELGRLVAVEQEGTVY